MIEIGDQFELANGILVQVTCISGPFVFVSWFDAYGTYCIPLIAVDEGAGPFLVTVH